ncbi:hypothetical protein B0H34DRAFT_697698 [Crassisporium funariophilum]|nr:hypothetical protein B0H34DRAFT_697698 [Crassisporium funariophilum]
MSSIDIDIEPFLSWFQSHHGQVDTSSLGIRQFPASEGGRGAVALKDIPEGHVVFSIPRSLILSTRTCTLPARFGVDAWKALGLNQGWAGLILCMMWEAALGPGSKWATYFDILPRSFDTPMFWNADDLAELQGTSVVGKLGREQAAKDYGDKVVPAVRSRPDLFGSHDVETCYSLETYHLMGSRLLSRSFTLDKEDEEDQAPDVGNSSLGSAMDVDDTSPHNHSAPPSAAPPVNEEEEAEAEAEAEEAEEDGPEVVLVPLADMLNGRYNTENVRLFCEPDVLKMTAIKPIKEGDQIWNTYGDLPNCELLRVFGHVDYLPLPEGGHGNPGDIVEVRADLVVGIILEEYPALVGEDMAERIDWWLEEGGDDVFVIEYDLELPMAFTSFIRLILLRSEWEKAKEKARPPRPKADAQTLGILQKLLDRRIAQYPTTIRVRLLSFSLSLIFSH